MADDLENLVFRLVERWMAGRYTERHGLVTSYDPVKYLAKVTFQPDGQVSDWLPIETEHVGNGYGVVAGLTPGDGKSTGDQVIVRFQEGDFEGGKITRRVHSQTQPAPQNVQSGEYMTFTQWGQQIYFKNDGSLTAFTGNGTGTIKMDSSGNITVSGKVITVTATGALNLNGAPINFNGGGPSTPPFTVPG